MQALEVVKVSVADPAAGNHGATGYSGRPSVSADGRWVAYDSNASNIVAGDRNRTVDVFLFDRQTSQTVRVSLDALGREARGDAPSLSADGRYVAFRSDAEILPGGFGFGIYRKDMMDGSTVCVTQNNDGSPLPNSCSVPKISADGNVVVFDILVGIPEPPGGTAGKSCVLVRNVTAGTTVVASVASDGISPVNGHSGGGCPSADGRYVAFHSDASNLVSGDTSPGVFVRDMVSGTTVYVSRSFAGGPSNGGSSSPAISADGRYVAYVSSATDLTPAGSGGYLQIHVWDRVTGLTRLVSHTAAGAAATGNSTAPAISADGRRISFVSQAADLVAGVGVPGVLAVHSFVYDTVSDTIVVADISTGGTLGDSWSLESTISGDGAFVMFTSGARNLVPAGVTLGSDVFARPLDGGATERCSIAKDGYSANGPSTAPSSSADGRRVAFLSDASNLVVGDTNGSRDAFCRDLDSGVTRRIDVSSSGVQGNAGCESVRISSNGRYVFFASGSDNLIDGSVTTGSNVYRHDLTTGETRLCSVTATGDAAGFATLGDCSADGRYVLMDDIGGHMLPEGGTGYWNCVVRDMVNGTTALVSVSLSGQPGNDYSPGYSISADGRRVSFGSYASDLVPGDDNGALDVFIRDMSTGVTTRVIAPASPGSFASLAYPTVFSADGRFLVFDSVVDGPTPTGARDHRDVFRLDLASGAVVPVSMSTSGTVADGDSNCASLCVDGSRVAYVGAAMNQHPYSTSLSSIFVRDMDTGSTRLINISNDGVWQPEMAYLARIGDDGRHVVYAQDGIGLTSDDDSDATDVFISYLAEPQTITCDDPGTIAFQTTALELHATATSGLPVAYSVASGPAEVRGGSVFLTGTGVVVLCVDQPGNIGRLAAPQVQRTLHVVKATAGITVTGLRVAADGRPHAVHIVTVPSGLAVIVRYDGSATPPSSVGDHIVEVEVDDPNYSGSSSAVMTLVESGGEDGVTANGAGGSGGCGGGAMALMLVLLAVIGITALRRR